MDVTEQRVADQLRVIIKNKLLSDTTISEIKKKMEQQLQSSTECTVYYS